MFYSHKKITFILLVSIILSAFPEFWGGEVQAQEVTRMTLDEAIAYAFQNSSAIKTSMMNIQDADLLIKENKSTALPKVSAEVNLQRFVIQPGLPASALGFGNDPVSMYSNTYTSNRFKALEEKNGITPPPFSPPASSSDGKVRFQLKNNFNGGITANQLLFSGSYTLAVRASQYYKDLVNVQFAKKQDSLRNAVIDAYLPTHLIDESIKTLDKNIKNLEKTFADVKATFKAGFIEQLDVDRLEFSINNLIAQRDNLVRQREIPLNALKLTINFPLDSPLALNDDINSLLKPFNEAELLEAVDYQNRSEIKEIQASKKLVDLNVELVRSGRLPTVVAFGSYQYALQGNEIKNMFGVPSAVVGIKATYPIWDSNERKIKTQRAILSVEQFNLVRKDVERVINFQVGNARIAVVNAQKNLENQQKNLALADRIYSVTQKKYKEGVGSSLELTTAERDIYAAQQTVRQAQYDLLVAQRYLHKVLGK